MCSIIYIFLQYFRLLGYWVGERGFISRASVLRTFWCYVPFLVINYVYDNFLEYFDFTSDPKQKLLACYGYRNGRGFVCFAHILM